MLDERRKPARNVLVHRIIEIPICKAIRIARIESARIILFLLKIAPAVRRRSVGNCCEFKRRERCPRDPFPNGTRVKTRPMERHGGFSKPYKGFNVTQRSSGRGLMGISQ
jgi:hypothetical protein